MRRIDLWPVLSALAAVRPAFHSEADFQHALAWALHEDDARRRISLEYRPPVDEAMYLDIYLRGEDGWRTGIELKYWTKKAHFEVGGEPFRLRDQGAHDVCRYDFVKDMARLERLISAGVLDDGWVVALTNDPAYWSPSTRADTIDAAFRLSDGRTLEGQLGWASHAGAGTTRGPDRRARSGRYVRSELA